MPVKVFCLLFLKTGVSVDRSVYQMLGLYPIVIRKVERFKWRFGVNKSLLYGFLNGCNVLLGAKRSNRCL